MTYGYGPYYPDDMTGPMVCIAEGHAGPNCSRCGEVNYAWLGYLGYIGRMAKRWGVTKEEAEQRIEEKAQREYEAVSCSRCFDPIHSGPCTEVIAGYPCECEDGVPYAAVTQDQLSGQAPTASVIHGAASPSASIDSSGRG